MASPVVQTPALVECPACEGVGTCDGIRRAHFHRDYLCTRCDGRGEVESYGTCRTCSAPLTADEASQPGNTCDPCWSKANPTAGVDFVAQMARSL